MPPMRDVAAVEVWRLGMNADVRVAATGTAIILAVGLLVAFLAELASDDWGWRWGSAGEWVGGIGGILAFVAALGIAWGENRRYHDERQRREASEQELRNPVRPKSSRAIAGNRAAKRSRSPLSPTVIRHAFTMTAGFGSPAHVTSPTSDGT